MRYIILFLLFIWSTFMYGQTACKIVGSVQDINKGRLQGAAIRMLSVPDSVFIQGAQTDASGVFSLDVSVPRLILEIKLLGFKTLYRSLQVDLSRSEQNIGEIVLEDRPIALKEVSVTANAPAIVTKGDTIEYNTGIYSLPESASVRDLLKILPNVTITNSGIIMVQGKEVKKILVDGREFFSGDPELASKALPGKIVNKVQVVDRASVSAQLTGFDNEKKETIINLDVKEEMKTAIMANANVGGGLDIENNDAKYENNAYINLMKDKRNFTIFMQSNNTNGAMEGSVDGILKTGQVGLNISKDYSEKLKVYSDIIYDAKQNKLDSEFRNRSILTTDEYLYDNNRNSSLSNQKNIRANSRFEWKPNDVNTLFVKIGGAYNVGRNEQTETFESLNNAFDTLYNGNSSIYSKSRGYYLDMSMDYAYHFKKKKGRVFSLSLEGHLTNGRMNDRSVWHQSLFENNLFKKDSLLNQRIKNENNNQQMLFSLSYVEPVSKRSLIQLLYKFQGAAHHRDKLAYDKVLSDPDDSMELINSSQSIESKHYVWEQWFTLNFKSSFKKMTCTLGANVIWNNTRNKTIEPYATASDRPIDSFTKQNTVLFSPTVNFKYAFTNKKTLKLDYRGLMTPPSPVQTQDYVDSGNPTHHTKGNPHLKPQFSNEVMVSYSGSNPRKQTYYSLSVFSRFIINDIRSATNVDVRSGGRMTTYHNFNGNWNAGMNSTFNIPLANKDFKVGNALSLFIDNTNSTFNDLPRTMRRFTLSESPSIRYYQEKFNFRIEGIFSLASAKSNIRETDHVRTFDWGGSIDASLALPYKFRLGSTLRWIHKKGYGSGYDYSKTIWNAMVSRPIFSSARYGEGMIRFTVNDMLQSRRNSSLVIGDNSFRLHTAETIGCYFLGSLTYNFNFFPNAR